jgi:hypothetical protein
MLLVWPPVFLVVLDYYNYLCILGLIKFGLVTFLPFFLIASRMNKG